MSLQPVKMFIILTALSSFSLAQPICKRLLNHQKIPLMQVPDEVLTRAAQDGVYLVKAKDFLTHFETISAELRNDSSAELMVQFEELARIEQAEHGGLTGIRHEHLSARDLIVDLTKAVEMKRENFKDLSDSLFETLKQEAQNHPASSAKLFSNYFRNELSSLQAFGVYPTFFEPVIRLNDKSVPVRLKMVSSNMSPTADFRIYTSLVQREVIRRLVENPKKFFLEIGLEYPKDDSVLKDSLADLKTLLYYSHGH